LGAGTTVVNAVTVRDVPAGALQIPRPAADALPMRSLLEFLGLVEPDSSRREPVALPAWARRLVPIGIVVLTFASMLVFALVRVIAG
jgi:hypothetical protein